MITPRRRIVAHLSVVFMTLTAVLTLGITGASEGAPPPGVTLPNVSVLGTNSVRLQNSAQITAGHVVVNNALSGPSLTPSFELGIGGTATTPAGYAIVADSIQIAGGAVVGGNAFFNNISNSGTINGTQNSPLSLSVFSTLPTFKSTAGALTGDVTVPKNGAQTIPPGNYRDISVKSGGTLNFNQGIFNVRSINVENSGKLFFQNLASGNTEVRVSNQVTTANGSVIGPSGLVSANAAKIVFYVAFTTPAAALTPAAVSIGNGSTVLANLYAPNGTLVLGNSTNAAGAFIGKNVDVGNSVHVDLKSFFVSAAPVAASQGPLATGEDTPLPITLSASDVDSPSLTFTIVSPPAHGGLSAIVPISCSPPPAGGATCTASVTYTPTANYNGPDSFTFKANDGFGDSNVATVSITVNAAADAPVANSQSGVSTAEETTKQITLSGTDPDGDTLTFAIVPPGPSHGTLGAITPILPCTIDVNGASTCTATVDYTPETNFSGNDSFTFTVNDGTTTSAPGTVSITVTNTNDAPVAAGQTVDVDQNTAKTITLSATDVDGNNLTFSIVPLSGPTHGSLSAIVPISCTGTGTSTCTADVTYTPNTGYTGPDEFKFKANDGTVDSNEATVTINVANINDAPTDISLSNSTVAENQPVNTVVGTLSATDPDAGDTHTFSLVAGVGATDNASFNILGNQLRTSAALDFEAGSSRSIRVRATDSGSLFFEKVFTITVTNANDAPTDIALSPSSVAENQPVNTVVGTLSATDQDAGDTHTFSLVAGVGDTDNASFNISGNQLRTSATFDFETKNSYSIRVQATDSGSATFSKQITVTITNVNEAPTDIALSSSSVAENQPTNTVVGTLSATDPDAGDTHTFSLVAGAGDTDNASFNISGNQLRTSVSFDFETKSSYSIRVQVSDSGSLTFQKQFTITITNANDAPTDIALSNASVNENQPVNTVVGSFSATDQDAGDTHTFTLVAGTGSDDNASFNISGNQLRTSAIFNFEVKNSYTIRVRATDSGALFFEKVFAITVLNVNDAPVAQDKNYGANSAQANMKRSIPAATGLLAGATDEDTTGQTLSVGTVSATTPAGGNVTVNSADGSFDFNPPPGVTGNVTFTYTVCDDGAGFGGAGAAQCSAAKTVTFNVATPVIWFVDPNLGANGDGRLSNPFNSLASANTAKGTNANHRIFVYDGTDPDNGATTAAGVGVTLDVAGGQWLVGQGVTGTTFDALMGIAPPTGTIARPGINRTRPVIQGTVAMNGNNSVVRGLNITPSSAAALGLTGGAVTGVTVGEVDVTTVNGTAVSLNGTGGTVSIGNVTSTTGTVVSINGGTGTVDVTGTVSRPAAVGTVIGVTNRTSGTITFSGGTKTLNTADTGVNLVNNTGATINFTNGGLSIVTTTGTGFNATGGGTVTVQGTGNTINSTSATALNVANTTIGASGLTFQSISAGNNTGDPDPANGIVLNTTGASGGLTVTAGGTIQHTTSHGIALTSTHDVSLNQMNIQTTGGSGISGVGVTNFTFTNGTVNNSGDAVGEANIAFNGNGSLLGNNFSGTLTITGSTLTNAFDHGIHVEGNDGTVANAVITGNTITSTTSQTTSKGTGIQLVGAGTAATVSNLTKATISNNTIRNFPSGAGIQVIYGNTNAGGPAGRAGTAGSLTDIITITNNTVRGATATNRFNTDAIAISINGGNSALRSQGNFDVSNNGTVAEPIGNSLGTVILIGNNGFATMTATVNNNVIVGNNFNASPGIGGGNGIVVSSAETPDLTLTASGNDISATDGNGILLVGRGVTGLAKLSIKNNTVDAPLSGVRPGIRVDAGNNASVDDAVCLDISGNTSAGSGGTQGIGLRKEGTNSTVNDFGIEGMAATNSPGVEAFVDGQNPAGGGTLLISATSGFSNCNTAP